MKRLVPFALLLAGVVVGLLLARGQRPPDEKEAVCIFRGGTTVVTCKRWTLSIPGEGEVETDHGREPISDFDFPHFGFVFPKRTTIISTAQGQITVQAYYYHSAEDRETLIKMLSRGLTPIVDPSKKKVTDFTVMSGAGTSVFLAVGNTVVTSCKIDAGPSSINELVSW